MGSGWLSEQRLSAHARAITCAWIGYWAALTILLHSPKLPRSPISFSKRGLVIHATTFAILAVGAALVRRARGRRLSWAWLATWGVVFSLYGAASELLQPLSHRHCDPWDWVADTAGALVGLLLCTLVWANRDRRTPDVADTAA